MGLGLVRGSGVPQGGGRDLKSFGVTQSGRRSWRWEGLGEGFGKGGIGVLWVWGRVFGVPQGGGGS